MTTGAMQHRQNPQLVLWQLTTGCNLRCRHCRATVTERTSPEDLSYPECLNVVNQLARYAPLVLLLGGGEPLWRRDVFDIARHAARRRLRVELTSNGTLVDETMAERIQEAGIARVSISLDGSEAASHDEFRGLQGAFGVAVHGIRCLAATGVPTQINTTVTKRNGHQLAAMLELAAQLGVKAVHLFIVVPVGCGLTVAKEESLSGHEAEEILSWFYEQASKTRMELTASCAASNGRTVRPRPAREGSAGIPLAPAPHYGLQAVTNGCLAGHGVCFISHVGEVYPCGYLPVSAGNLRDEKFHDIWEHAEVLERLRRPEELEAQCEVCEFRNVCSGCRTRAYEHGGRAPGAEPGYRNEPRGICQVQ